METQSYTVIKTKNGEIVDECPFTDANDAIKDYNRQARNAWRRKSAYCQVQFNDVYQMSWYEGTAKFRLEIKGL